MTLKWYVGDCREILKSIPDKSIDFVVTSPPYNIGKDYGIYKDNISHEEYLEFMGDVLKECHRIIVDDGRIAFNIPHVEKRDDDNKQFPILYHSRIIINSGFNIREIVTWYKSNEKFATISRSTSWGSWCSASNPHMRGDVEYIIIANKNEWKKNLVKNFRYKKRRV